MSRIIFIVIGFLVLLLVLFFLVWPKYQKLDELKAKIEVKEIELSDLKEHYLELKKLYSKLEEYPTQLEKINTALPSNAPLTLLSVINFLQQQATANGLEFKKLNSTAILLPKVDQTAKKDTQQPITNIKELKVDFEVLGIYPALKNFLVSLEESAKLIEVERISFSFEESETFPFSLVIKTYSY